MSQFKVGDWVIITHRSGPETLCILGKLLAVNTATPYRGGIHVETIWAHDPNDWESHNPGYWPTDGPNVIIERCGPPDGAPEGDVPV